MARPKPKPAARYLVTLDRADGGQPIEEKEVTLVNLVGDMLVIIDGKRPIFSGSAWNWVEVRKAEYEASVAPKLGRPGVAGRARRERATKEVKEKA
ncbi:MAG TPA: hypothetical protein VGS12_18950 [Caulobacteraceae bacterium]|nr:hypothetical protein [Caulobacteraceae bacterium]